MKHSIIFPVVLFFLAFSCNAQTQTHKVLLSWPASTTSCTPAPCTPSPITGYNLYRSETSGAQDFTQPLTPAPVTGTAFTDLTVFDGHTYFYKVKSVCDLCTPKESTSSPEAKAVIPGVSIGAPPASITVNVQVK
jgi:hypothetical protein